MFVPVSYGAAFHRSLKSNKYNRQREARYVFTEDDPNACQVKKQKASLNSRAGNKRNVDSKKGQEQNRKGTKAQRPRKNQKAWEKTKTGKDDTRG